MLLKSALTLVSTITTHMDDKKITHTRVLAFSYMSLSTFLAYSTKLFMRVSLNALRSGLGNIACTLFLQRQKTLHYIIHRYGLYLKQNFSSQKFLSQ